MVISEPRIERVNNSCIVETKEFLRRVSVLLFTVLSMKKFGMHPKTCLIPTIQTPEQFFCTDLAGNRHVYK